jgi:outer membrane lipoprotein-sorting protein
MKSTLAICVVFAGCAMVAASGPQSAALKDVLNRLDQAAKLFHSTSAHISWTKHTEVLNDNSTQTGMAYRAKTPKGLLGLFEIVTPDKKAYAFEGRTLQIYYPNIPEVQIYDAGEQGQQLEQFLMLGFGTSGIELERMYEMRIVGPETVKDEKTIHLALNPKSGEAKKLVKQVDLWISERGNYPIQEKVLEPSGDYTLLVFSDVQNNNPSLKDADLRLKLPDGVKKRYPQKEK